MADLDGLIERLEAASGPIEYGEARRLEYEIAALFPPMDDPRPFLRDAKDPATFDHIVKMDVYDGIGRWLAHEDDAARFVERTLPGWQWAMWGGAIEVGSTQPRCVAHVSDGRFVLQESGGGNACVALMICALKALRTQPPHAGNDGGGR